MNILLDTCAFLWIAKDASKLSPTAYQSFKSTANTIFLSSISAWEISVKYRIGKLNLPYSPEQFIPRERKRHFINKLPLSENDTFQLAQLPDIHKDPFDRILICQAIENGLTILTPDRHRAISSKNIMVKNLASIIILCLCQDAGACEHGELLFNY